MPCRRRRSTYASQQYCTPRSEWCIRPSRFSLPCHLNGLVYGLPQRLKRGWGTQAISQYPSHYLMGISIRDQMQVTDVSAGKRYIGNIANPQLIGRVGTKPLSSSSTYGNDGWNWLCPWLCGEEASGGVDEAACRSCRDRAWTSLRRGGEHDPQLVTTDTGILATYLTYGIQHETFILHMAPYVSLDW